MSGFGTLSILASLDLLDGHVIARVEPRHRSVEFVSLLKDLDAYYPPECIIRIVGAESVLAATGRLVRARIAASRRETNFF